MKRIVLFMFALLTLLTFSTPTQAATNWEDVADEVIKDAFALKPKVKYVYNKYSPSTFEYDCSSFVKHLYKTNDVINMWWGARKQSTYGEFVYKKNLRKGDLVFFSTPRTEDNLTQYRRIGHVGIYIGGGKFIHNVNPTHDVVVSDINSAYWSRHYIKATRVIK